MAAPKKTLRERQIDAEDRANRYLADFNEMDEAGRGNTPKAQRLWQRGQYWLDRLNLLTNYGEKAGPRR